MEKVCLICGKKFIANSSKKNCRASGSKTCSKECSKKLERKRMRGYMKNYYKESDNLKRGFIKYYYKLKEKVFFHYGGNPPHCANPECPYHDEYVPTIHILTVDHIDENAPDIEIYGRKLYHIRLCSFLIKKNFPDGYQILCRNCNYLKYLERKWSGKYTRIKKKEVEG